LPPLYNIENLLKRWGNQRPLQIIVSIIQITYTGGWWTGNSYTTQQLTIGPMEQGPSQNQRLPVWPADSLSVVRFNEGSENRPTNILEVRGTHSSPKIGGWVTRGGCWRAAVDGEVEVETTRLKTTSALTRWLGR
jgi:hypothetical protein